MVGCLRRNTIRSERGIRIETHLVSLPCPMWSLDDRWHVRQFRHASRCHSKITESVITNGTFSPLVAIHFVAISNEYIYWQFSIFLWEGVGQGAVRWEGGHAPDGKVLHSPKIQIYMKNLYFLLGLYTASRVSMRNSCTPPPPQHMCLYIPYVCR